jgi:hypothetical protein
MDPLLTPKQVQDQYGIATKTLSNYRWQGIGPDYVKTHPGQYGRVQGAIGELGGLPVVVDANLPNNLGAGTNEDRIITARFDEIMLWESAPRVRILQEVLSGTLQVRVQLYSYFALIANRRPKAISVISGTGLAGLAAAGF